MRNVEWDRAAAITRLRGNIWRYVTRASRDDDEIVLNAAALLRMPVAEVRLLAQLRFILSDEVGRLIEQLPFLVRRLTTTTLNEREVSAERVRGAIRWGETFGHRAATGLPHAFVTAPTRRAFETPENQVLAFALRVVAEFGARTGWHDAGDEGVAGTIRARVAEATRWRQARALAGLGESPPTPTMQARVRAGRARSRYQAALDVVELYSATSPGSTAPRCGKPSSATRWSSPTTRRCWSSNECAFGTIAALRAQGWVGSSERLLPATSLLFSGRRDGARLDVFYQYTPRELSQGSRYGGVQRAHAFAYASRLRPDLVLRHRADGAVRWLVIEVKGRKGGVVEAGRDALFDLLAYRRAYDRVLTAQAGPYGIGCAWGAELEPALDAEIVLCTPDTLGRALEAVLGGGGN